MKTKLSIRLALALATLVGQQVFAQELRPPIEVPGDSESDAAPLDPREEAELEKAAEGIVRDENPESQAVNQPVSKEAPAPGFKENHGIITDSVKGVEKVGGGAVKGVEMVGGGAVKGVEMVGGGAVKGVEMVGGGAVKGVEMVGGGAVKGVEMVGGGAVKGVEMVGGGAVKGVEMVGGGAVKGVEAIGKGARVGVEKVGAGALAGGSALGRGAERVGQGAVKGAEALGSGALHGAEKLGRGIKSLGKGVHHPNNVSDPKVESITSPPDNQAASQATGQTGDQPQGWSRD